MYKEHRQLNSERLGRISAHCRNHINGYEREIVQRIGFGRTGIQWHVKQVTFSRYIADFYVRHIKLAVFLNRCSDQQTKCLHHYGFHVLSIDPNTQTPQQAVEMMAKRARTLIAMRERRRIKCGREGGK